VIISAVAFGFDYQLGFEKTKYWTAVAVVLYFILNSGFMLWTTYVEKDLVFTGDKQGRKVSFQYGREHT